MLESQPVNPAFLQERKFEIQADIGKIVLQIVDLPAYKWIIITQAKSLKINGNLQVGFPTPYSNDPSVLNLETASQQPESDDLCKRISKKLNVPIVLSVNVEVQLSIKDRKEIFQFLCAVLQEKQEKKQKQ